VHERWRLNRRGSVASLLVFGFAASCTEPAGVAPATVAELPAPGGSGGVAGRGGSAGSPGVAGLMIDATVGGQAGSGCIAAAPSDDVDHDGFTVQAGDCNDCEPAVNPGAYDFAGNGVDEDCSGAPDDEARTCDAALEIAGDDAMDAARALGLCRVQTGQSWGVVAARWVYPNGELTSRSIPDIPDIPDVPHVPACAHEDAPVSPDSRGVLSSFGPNVQPREGKALVALSTGVARPGIHQPLQPAQGTSPAGAMMCTDSVAPPGFPKDSPACPYVTTAQNTQARDAVALELEIKAPTNARALAFDFDFYTYEWPQYVCSEFNDFFVALLRSGHVSTPADENISFDKLGNPVSVNNGFVEVCDPVVGALRPGGKAFDCALGTSELVGTGFDTVDGLAPSVDFDEPQLSSHAATGWLSTTAAIVPGETLRLRFAVWDMLDASLDSTVLLDHFEWTLIEPTVPTTERPPRVE
jgi:hypothetical protein